MKPPVTVQEELRAYWQQIAREHVNTLWDPIAWSVGTITGFVERDLAELEELDERIQFALTLTTLDNPTRAMLGELQERTRTATKGLRVLMETTGFIKAEEPAAGQTPPGGS